MKALIYGTVYIQSPERAELVQMWIENMLFINPDFPIVLIDSATDPLWRELIPQTRHISIHTVAEGDPLPELQLGLNWIDFPENLGHLMVHNIDGWGRAFCRGIELAITQNYDYVVNIESDLLFRPNVTDILKQMDEKNIKALCGFERNYGFIENCLCFMNTQYLKDIDFIGQYDWKAQTQENLAPELRTELLLGKEMFVRPWLGCRDDFGRVTVEQVRQFEYITHAHDQNLYYEFMKTFMPTNWAPPCERG